MAKGQQVVVNTGGQLSLQSLQDTSTYDSKSSSMGVGVTVFIPGLCSGTSSVNASVGKTRIDSDFASVAERTSIQAGDQGFQVNVAGSTVLQGAVIASTDKAVQEGKNTLNTQGLSLSNVDNKAEFKAQAYSVNVSTSAGQSSAGFGKASDQAASTTTAGVSGIAGDASVRTGDQQQGIANIFDKDKVSKDVNAQVTITAEFGKQAAKAVGDYGQSKTKPYADASLRQELDRKLSDNTPLTNPELIELARLDREGMTSAQAAANLSDPQLKQDHENWKEGGTYRVALHTVAGGLNGGLGGALGAGASSAAANSLDNLQGQLQGALQQAGLPEVAAKGIASVATGATAATLGAALGGTAGAAAGFSQDMNNRQLHPSEKQRIRDLAKGDPQKEARLTAAACAMVKCYAEYPEGSATYNALKAMADASKGDDMAVERQQLQAQQGLFNYSTQGLLSDMNIDTAKQFNNTYQITTRTLGAGQALLGGAGVAGSVVTAPASCATGVGCVANAAVATLSADAAVTGFKQAISGQPESTYINQALQGLGLSAEAASYAEFALGVGAAAKAANTLVAPINLDAAANAWAKGTYTGKSTITYQDRVYRFSDPEYAAKTWEIYPGNVMQNHRYSEPGIGSIYSGTSVQTSAAEVASYSQNFSGFKPKALVAGDVRIDNVLDLTDPAALRALGVTKTQLIQSSHGANGAYTQTQRIAEWAREQGYNGILAPSAQNKSGTNLITFDNTVVSNVKTSPPPPTQMPNRRYKP